MGFIRSGFSNGSLTVWLSRPPLNILNIQLMEELTAALRNIGAETHVVILRGEGGCFSAGVAVEEHLGDKAVRMLAAFEALLDTVYRLEVPTVAAVHGYCLGGGMELALAADLVYAAESATFAQPEIKVGVFPPFAAAYYSSLVGMKRAAELILTGRTLTAKEAQEWGLINAVFPDAEFSQRVEALANELSALSKPVLVLAKKALRLAKKRPLLSILKDVDSIYLNELMKLEDYTEGLRAFLEKRKPQFKDR